MVAPSMLPAPSSARAAAVPVPSDMEDEDEQLQLQRALIMSKQRMGEGLVKDDGKPAAKPKRKRRVIEESDEEDDGGALEGLTSQPSLPEPPSKNDDGHPSATADHARPGGVPPPPSLPWIHTDLVQRAAANLLRTRERRARRSTERIVQEENFGFDYSQRNPKEIALWGAH